MAGNELIERYNQLGLQGIRTRLGEFPLEAVEAIEILVGDFIGHGQIPAENISYKINQSSLRDLIRGAISSGYILRDIENRKQLDKVMAGVETSGK